MPVRGDVRGAGLGPCEEDVRGAAGDRPGDAVREVVQVPLQSVPLAWPIRLHRPPDHWPRFLERDRAAQR